MISAVIIAFNEADRIGATLESLTWCDEIIVVDSGSTDGTQAIAESYGSKVVHHTFNGYGAQKRYACSLASYSWIFSVDADEIVSQQLSAEILSTLQSTSEVALTVSRRFRFLGRTFRHGRSSVDHPIRVFKKDQCTFDDAHVHESVVVNGSIGNLNGEMLHDSYRNLDHYFHKFNEYTSRAAEQLVRSNTNRSLLLTILSIPLYFIKHYIVGGHIFNGIEGFMWSLFSSWYPVVKVAKVWSHKKGQQSR